MNRKSYLFLSANLELDVRESETKMNLELKGKTNNPKTHFVRETISSW